MKDIQPVVYGVGIVVGLVTLWLVWPFIVGGLALAGLWCLLTHHNNHNNRRPPRCRR